MENFTNAEHVNPIWEPFITTTPDESLPFCAVKKYTSEFRKLVFENYINFHAFDHRTSDSDGFVLRFENYHSLDQIDILTSIHVPVDVIRTEQHKLSVVKNMLQCGYVLLADYNKYYVSQFREKAYISHRIIIYGYHEVKRRFYCCEFINMRLHKIEVPYEELIYAISYYPWEKIYMGGIQGIRINPNKNRSLSYIKLLQSIMQFDCCENMEISNGIDAFGKKALIVFLHGIETYPELQEKVKRCQYFLSYIDASLRLMKCRTEIILEDEKKRLSNETLRLLDHCIEKTKIASYRVIKALLKEKYTSIDITNEIYQYDQIVQIYSSFMSSFENDLRMIMQDSEEREEREDIYYFSRNYRRMR